MNNNELNNLFKFIKEEDDFLLLSHVLPDGDSVGSTIACAEMLKALGKSYKILFRDPVPEIYKFLLAEHKVHDLTSIQEDKIPANFIVLDCSEFERVGEELQFLLDKAKKIINIDHHISNNYFGSIKIVKSTAAATCEVLYYILKEMKIPITQNAAKALYTGIATDTGGFRYESTSKGTFLAAAELMELGVDLGEIRENVYENKDWATVIILQKALANLTRSQDGRLAWLYVSAQDMAEANATGEHCEGIVNYPLAISGVKMGFFFREMQEGKIKVGLRARRNFNVNAVAAVFGGGGHAQAAGCTLDGPLEDAVASVIKAAKANLKGEI